MHLGGLGLRDPRCFERDALVHLLCAQGAKHAVSLDPEAILTFLVCDLNRLPDEVDIASLGVRLVAITVKAIGVLLPRLGVAGLREWVRDIRVSLRVQLRLIAVHWLQVCRVKLG